MYLYVCIYIHIFIYTYIYIYVCIYIYIIQSNLQKSISPIPTPGVRGSYDFLELGQQPLILEAKKFEFPDAPSRFVTYMVRDSTKQVGVYIPMITIRCCGWMTIPVMT